MQEELLQNGYTNLNKLIIRVTCLCWLPVKLLGWRMFTKHRRFPTAPVFKIFDNSPPIVDDVLFGLSLLMMIMLFIFPKNKLFITGLLAVEFASCLLDQNRIHPWDYLYMFTLFIFAVNANHQKLTTIAFVFILASTYFYSGLGKLNEGFLQTIWSKMFLDLFLKIPVKITQQSWLHDGGLCAGFFELMAGVGLLFSKTKKIAAAQLITMHFFILFFLGPFGLSYNRIVWPWNIAMILYLYLIFFKNEWIGFQFKYLVHQWNILVFIFWGILPSLNLVGYWDNYLSSGLYSAKLPEMLICIKDTSKCPGLKRFCKPDYKHVCDGCNTINLDYWALSETNVAPYPEIRVFKKIQQKLEFQYPAAGLSFRYLLGDRKQN